MLPLELMTAVSGLLIGAYVNIKQQQNETFKLAMKRDSMEIADRQSARNMSSPGIQYTKRLIALILVGTWTALHLGVSVPDLLGLDSTVTVGYTELRPKFLFFGGGEAIKWVTVQGAAITPAFNNVVILIIAYYFGSGGTRRNT